MKCKPLLRDAACSSLNVLAICAAALIFSSSFGLAHPGGLNAEGCHGGSQPYHCHRSGKGAGAGVIKGRVTHVRDADTIVVDGIPIRINGLDAVERGEPGYREAKAWVERLVLGKTLECRLNGQRTHDRMVGTCFVDGRDFAELVISAGHGLDCPRYSGGRYSGFETPKAKRARTRAGYCRGR